MRAVHMLTITKPGPNSRYACIGTYFACGLRRLVLRLKENIKLSVITTLAEEKV